MRFWYHWKEKIKGFPMIPKSYDLDKWVAKYFISKDETYRDTEKRRKDTEKCTIQYLFSMSVSFPYHFSIFSVSEFFIEQKRVLIILKNHAPSQFHVLSERLAK